MYKKKELLVLSTGEYSDYSIRIICRVLKNFTQKEVTDLYPGKKKNYDFIEDKFVQFLISEGFIEEVDYREWTFSTYSNLELYE